MPSTSEPARAASQIPTNPSRNLPVRAIRPDTSNRYPRLTSCTTGTVATTARPKINDTTPKHHSQQEKTRRRALVRNGVVSDGSTSSWLMRGVIFAVTGATLAVTISATLGRTERFWSKESDIGATVWKSRKLRSNSPTFLDDLPILWQIDRITKNSPNPCGGSNVVLRNLSLVLLSLLGAATLAATLGPSARITIDTLSMEPRVRDEAFSRTVHQVNLEFQNRWKQQSIQAAPPADDLSIARRISLALSGTIPALEDIRKLQQHSQTGRLDWWVDHLLEDRRYSDYIAERLARAYVGTEGGPFLIYRRRRFVAWLSDQLYQNVPYNELVSELIAGTGLWTDSPAVNFVTVTTDQNGTDQPDEIRLAGRTTRAFLGIRLDCMQCHDDNLHGQWMQSDFHELAAFYSEARNSLLGIRDNPRPYEYQYLDADQKTIVNPQVPCQNELLDSTQGARRQQLARWTTHPENEAYARAIVNRMWALLFGKPLIQPVDDIPLTGPYPAGMATLAKDFVENGHDLRRLIRLIVSTIPFRCDSRGAVPSAESTETEWACFPVSRLRPEQVAASILQASNLKTIDAKSHIVRRIIKTLQQSDFIDRYGDAGEDELGQHGGTIPQRLLLMNGKLIKERTQDDLVNNAATRVARLVRNDKNAVTASYLIALTRAPTAPELDHFVTRLKVSSASRTAVFEDLFWTLFNSTEFSWNH